MSLPPPQVLKILTPPSLAASSLLANNKLTTAQAALDALASHTHMATSTSISSPPPDAILQKHAVVHDCLPWVAYALHAPASATSNNSLSIVIQHLETQEILASFAWMDLAACLYGETNPSRLLAATKSLGAVVSLQFLDTATLYWNGFANSINGSTGTNTNFHWLSVQTTNRNMILQLRETPYSKAVVPTAHKATRQAWLVSHLHEKSLGGSVPSSNVLQITANLLLIGCNDGSLKVWDLQQQAAVKSIKGLGKGDWIVQILAANAYEDVVMSSATNTNSATASDTSATTMVQKKRMLTITKKGSVYLIEVEVGSNQQIEIKPPLARFTGGAPVGLQPAEGTKDSGKPSPMDHATSFVQFDGHRNWITWLSPAAKKGSPISSLLVWDLNALQADLVKSQDGTAVFKPDPTLVIQFPAGEGESLRMTVLPMVHHAAFSDNTILCAVATASAEFYLQATVLNNNNANSTVIASPVTGMNLSQLLQRELVLDAAPLVRVSSVRGQPLGNRPMVVSTTNVGLTVLDLDVPLLMGARHLHFGAGLGSLGKSVLNVLHSDVVYGSLDLLKLSNPVGRMEVKNPTSVFESPPAMHLPVECQNRPFRLAPSFFPSPSGQYVALFWPYEFRYEILHIASVLQKVGQRGATTTRNPAVASGTGVISFAWVGDEDDYAIVHAADLMEEAAMLMATAPVLVVPAADGGLTIANLNPANINVGNLMDIRSSAMGVANLTTSAAKAATKAATSATLNATKAATSATKAATTATLSVTKAATSATKSTTKAMTKGMKKSFGIFGKKKKGSDGGMDATSEEMSESTVPNLDALQQSIPSVDAMPKLSQRAKRHYVELRSLVPVDPQASELSSTLAAAASSGLGELTLRGGNRNPPTMIFGGPVLIVASRSAEDREGHAHFYTRKQDEKDNSASVYVSTGPTLPYPDICAWDDDGRLCAVVVQNRVAVYLSDLPDFVLLGAVRVGDTTKIVSAKFVHGVLFCSSWNSVHCIFLGDLENGICRLDSFTLASTIVADIPCSKRDYSSFSPPIVALPLVQPTVLGYQSGSVVVSTLRGVHAIPLTHPTLRIGALMSARQLERAVKWFDAVPDRQHEQLALFLERRGHPELALDLPGLSLETLLDMCMRNGYVGRLVEIVEEYGVTGLRAIDVGCGVSPGMFGPERDAHGIVVSVGAYLLAHGQVELTRRLATELLRSGDDGKKDALVLATLLLSVDENDASRLMTRAVGDDGKAADWLLGNFVREHILSARNV